MQYKAETGSSGLSTPMPDDAAYLLAIGSRVKRLRARRGMTRRILAQSSGVSERYLAELERGKGNISILRLRAIASAMGTVVEELVTSALAETPDFAFLAQYIRDASPLELARLRSALSGPRPQHARAIALIGLRGAGKSTLGRALAERLGVKFIELVQAIQELAGMQVNEIFSLGGQSTYRRFERQCLDEILASNEATVLAVGGSLVSEPASFDRLASSCVTIWLRATPEEHMNRVIAQGDQRPMAGNPRAMDDLKRILSERDELYRRADHIVSTSGRRVAESLNELLGIAEIAAIGTSEEVA